MGRVTQNHCHIYTDMYTWHVNTFIFLSLGLLSLKGKQKTYFCIHKNANGIITLPVIWAKICYFLNLSPLYSQNQNGYQTLLFFLLIIFPYPSLPFCPHCLFPPELLITIAGLPLLVLPFSTLFETQNKPPWEGHRPLRPRWREDSFTPTGADDL